jgi:hypothetical protein
MPYIDVDIDDFLTECSSGDLKTIIHYLIEDNIEDGMIRQLNKRHNIHIKTEIDEYLFKIQTAQIQLTSVEEEIIKQIADRLV